VSFLEDDDDRRVVRRDSALVLRLHDREVQVLRWVFADLDRLIAEGADADSVTKRLFPRAYLDPTEEAAEADWQLGAHGDLVELRQSALRAVALDLDAAAPVTGREPMREVVLDPERAEQWLGVLNDARLALGTALGLTADTDLGDIEPDDPRFEPYLVYDWLTHLLGALLGAVAEPGADEEDAGEDG
jgi:Domain of unknown function (DUF2017)